MCLCVQIVSSSSSSFWQTRSSPALTTTTTTANLEPACSVPGSPMRRCSSSVLGSFFLASTLVWMSLFTFFTCKNLKKSRVLGTLLLPFFGTSQLHGTLTRWFLAQSTTLNLALYLYYTVHPCTWTTALPFALQCPEAKPRCPPQQTAPRSSLILIFQDTSLPTPQLTFSILLTLTLIFLKT